MASDFFLCCRSSVPSAHSSKLEQPTRPINRLVQLLNRMRVIPTSQRERLISELAKLPNCLQEFAKRELPILDGRSHFILNDPAFRDQLSCASARAARCLPCPSAPTGSPEGYPMHDGAIYVTPQVRRGRLEVLLAIGTQGQCSHEHIPRQVSTRKIYGTNFFAEGKVPGMNGSTPALFRGR